MKLRTRFNVLSFIYVASMAASLIISIWCITRYFQTGFARFQADLITGQRIERVLGLLRDARVPAEREPTPATAIAEVDKMLNELVSDAASKPNGGAGEPLASALRSADEAAADLRSRLAADQAEHGSAGGSPSMIDSAGLDRLEQTLFDAGTFVGLQRQENLEVAIAAQQRALLLLILTAACGVGLCALGLAAIRRWLLRPVEILRGVIREISLGHLSHRVELADEGELKSLAHEINRMSSALEEMQAAMVRRERAAATGAMMQFVAHNLRTPLLGIRWLTEVLPPRHVRRAESARARDEILERIDGLNRWLQKLQEHLSGPRR